MLKIRFKEIKIGDYTILNESEFSVNPGLIMISGENGSGKSTLLNAIYRDIDTTGLSINCDDIDLSVLSTDVYRATYCSYIKQKPYVFDELSLLENLEMIVGHYDTQLFENLCTGLALQSKSQKQQMKKLSGGELQKANIIIGLLKDTVITLVDEPFNNLDQQSITFLSTYLQKQNKYMFITSHSQDQQFTSTLEICNGSLTNAKGNEINSCADLGEIFEKKKHLSEQHIKLLRKSNRKNNASLYVLNVIMFIIIASATLNITNTLMFALTDLSFLTYSDTATIIEPPISNQYINLFGDEKWLETTPAFFTDSDIERIKHLDYVVDVKPTKYSSVSAGGGAFRDKYFYDFANGELNIFMTESSYPQLVASGIPIQYNTVFSGNIEKILVGSFPEDKSNQVLVSNNLADHYVTKLGVSSIDELIGREITLPLSVLETGKIVDFTFEISGVYASSDTEAQKQGLDLELVTSFDESTLTNKRMYLDVEADEVYKQINNRYQQLGIPFSMNVEDLTERYYPGLYIEVDSEANLKNLTNDITNYDQYISISNNYTNSQSYLFKYTKTRIYKQVAMLGLIFILSMIIIGFVSKLFKLNVIGNMKKLDFYGFNATEQNNYQRKEISEYLIVTGLWQTLLSLLFFMFAINMLELTTNISVICLVIINLLVLIVNVILFKVKGIKK